MFVALQLTSSCHQPNGEPAKASGEQVHFATGPGERSLSDRLGGAIALPISEIEFLSVLDRHGLVYWIERQGDQGAPIPAPRWSTQLDTSRVSRVYAIDGGTDTATGITERYRAYVTGDLQVIYIENVFVYPPA